MGDGMEEKPHGFLSWQKILLISGAAALGLLLLLFGGKSKTAMDPDQVPAASADEEEAYREELEKRLEALCSEVRGVGEVRVVLTLSSGYSSVYATEEGRDGSLSLATVGSGSNQAAVILSRTPPEIAGVGVVCDGGGSSAVRQELTELISAVCHLPSNRIYVTEAR